VRIKSFAWLKSSSILEFFRPLLLTLFIAPFRGGAHGVSGHKFI
jgi:hypothetical protein